MRIMYWLLAGCFFTASCDVILLIKIGGSLRISQLFLALVCTGAIARIMQDGRILWPRGGTSISLWMFSQLLFLPFSGVIPIGIQFLVLLAFTVAGVFAVVQLWGRSPSLERIMRIYLLSYVFVAIFGLMQFMLPLVGLPGILVQQWLVHGKLARISGFNYEPSYFATYMIMGWIMLIELRISKAQITSGRLWKWATIAVTASLILSSSKTAWAFMIVEFVTRLIPLILRALSHMVRQLKRGTMLVPIPDRKAIGSLCVVAAIIVGTCIYLPRLINPMVLLSGTGIGNTAAHSYITRNGDARDTFSAFLDNPFIGRSLGGVAVYRAARLGIQVTTMEQVRLYLGFPVILDVLVASGILVFIPFLLFVHANTFGALQTAKRYWPSERARWLRALARGMIFECLILMTDQNLLRVYVWFHVTMVTLVAYNIEFGAVRETVAAELDYPMGSPLLEARPAT